MRCFFRSLFAARSCTSVQSDSSSSSSSSSSKRQPWHGSSGSNKSQVEHQQPNGVQPRPLQRRGSLLSRGLLRWGTGKSRAHTAADATPAGNTNSSGTRAPGSGQAAQSEDSAGASRPEAKGEGTLDAAASAAAAAVAAPPPDVVRGMAPPEPSFRFFDPQAGIEPLGFLDDVSVENPGP